MVEIRHVTPRAGDVVLFVGTTKGAFLFSAKPARAAWRRAGPFFAGRAVYALAYDAREGRTRVWAAPESTHWGAALRFSDDFGRTWSDEGDTPLRFPEDAGAALKRVWQICPGRATEPDVLYCGVEPAALFESRDGGGSWDLVRGLWDHPHRALWEPGFGGLCLHTILPDPTRPERLHVAVSTGGVYRTDDGGATWTTAHRGVRAQFLPDPHPEFGQCVHKVVRHPMRPARLFLQNHWGLYRSDDAGDSWRDIARGVPSDFGFAMAMHPHDPDCVYIVPLESDEFRCTPEGRLRVYRTRDAGRTWQALGRGLPQRDAHETVLRDALATDSLARAGIYFGTRSGKLFGSRDAGANFFRIADGLPPVVCVKAAVVTRVKTVVSAAERRRRMLARRVATLRQAA
jgi:hypothetical protein